MKQPTAKPKAEKAQNYTAEMEAIIKASAPLDLDKAKALSEQLGKRYKSIIAKALSLGVEYKKQEAAPKRPKAATKAELVKAIEASTSANLDGLEKATGTALARLLDSLKVLTRTIEEDRLLADD